MPSANIRFVLWLLVIGLFTAIGISQWQAGAKIQSDILAMLPKIKEDPLTKRALNSVESQLSNRIYLALVSSDQTQAINAAKRLMLHLKQEPSHAFSDISSADIAQGDAMSHFYFKHRFSLLTPTQKSLLSSGDWQQLTQQAQQKLYSAFGYANSNLIASDPLLLYPDNLMALLPQQQLSVKQGILIASVVNHESKQPQFAAIVMAKGVASAFNPNAQVLQITALNQAIDSTLSHSTDPSMSVLKAGALFHAYAATQSAKSEVSSIGVISLIGVILLVWLAFRSVMPLGVALVTISASLLMATVTTLVCFGELHLLTLVFGTSLIGISIDYCFHFYCERLRYPAMSATQTVRHIFPAISLALITSVAAYSSIGLAPFPGMQQVAIFCATGLTGAYLTLLLAYPKIAQSPLRPNPKALTLAASYQSWMLQQCNIQSRWRGLVLGLIILAACILGLLKLSSDDNIRNLQHTPPAIAAEEAALRTLLSGGTDNQFILVRGQNEEALKQHLEALTPVLTKAKAQRIIGNSISLSAFLPSQRTLDTNYQLQSQIYLQHLDEIAASLGLDDSIKPQLVSQFFAAQHQPITASAFFNDSAGKNLAPLWLAPTQDGQDWGAVVFLGGIKHLAKLQQLIESQPHAEIIDKVHDISQVMGHYRQLTLWLLAIALVIAALVLTARFGLKLAGVIVSVPALAAIFTLAALGSLGSALTLFHALALILVFGIGIDYSLFFAEAKQDCAGVMMAVFMSACSTLLAFGLLAFSQTPAIHAFGLTLLLGISFTFLLAPFIQAFTRK